jgi:hypothetical protein
LPLHAFYHKKQAPIWHQHNAQFWDNLSYHISVTSYQFLRDHDCELIPKSGEKVKGKYMFTIDYADSGEELAGVSETPDEHKCAHIVKLNNGNFAAYPNNRILWQDNYFIKQTDVSQMLYKPQTEVYFGESQSVVLKEKYMY